MRNIILVVIAVAMYSANCYAGLSANFAVVTDYVFRGQSQTAHRPAVQGGMDYEHESGFSLGTWLSNESFANATEADFYAAYSHQFSKNFSASLGGTFYHYTHGDSLDTLEGNLKFTVYMVDLSINYTGDYYGTDTSSWYFSAATDISLVEKYQLSLGLGLGYTSFDTEAKALSTNYLDYIVSINKVAGNYTFKLFYTDTTRKAVNSTGTIETEVDDHVYGLSAARTFEF